MALNFCHSFRKRRNCTVLKIKANLRKKWSPLFRLISGSRDANNIKEIKVQIIKNDHTNANTLQNRSVVKQRKETDN